MLGHPSWKHKEIDENEKRREGFKFLRKLGKIRNPESNVIEEEDEDDE